MKVLIITNSLQPAAAEHLGIGKSVRGGWVFSSAKQLAKEKDISICIASVHEHGTKFDNFKSDGIEYYTIPTSSRAIYDKRMEGYWKQIKSAFSPDIVHIYGTEFPLSLSYVRACGAERVLVSIQGMVGVYAQYYYGGLSFKEILKNVSLKDLYMGASIFQYRKSFEARGNFERELIEQVKDVEGRTSWDKENCWAINPDINYHLCYRTLRNEFYLHQWNYDSCEKHSIFLSQGRSALKGLHKVLEAVMIVRRHYPDVKVYVTNKIDLSRGKFSRFISGRNYDNYLAALIRKLKIEDNIVFTGYLDEKAMCERYLKSNVFICPSSIENSPNSVGEAQILGVPCIASYVGGDMDMVEDGQTGFLYRFEEVNMLAYKICKVFSMSYGELEKLSDAEIAVAKKRHDPETNKKRMVQIYKEILSRYEQ